MRQIILDTETTGLDAKEDRIIEIAALEMVERQLTGRTFHTLVQPNRMISEGALRIHGITQTDLANQPVFGEVVEDFLAFIKDSELIIHNAAFDEGMLTAELARLDYPELAAHCANIVDSLAIARAKFRSGRRDLDGLCDRFNIDRSMRTTHNALLDCELLAKVYICLTQGQTALFAEDSEGAATNTAPADMPYADCVLPRATITPYAKKRYQVLRRRLDVRRAPTSSA